ncbi:molybdenum ABC transporter ATP-binding protein [Microbacterium sorbitolivorans]|uniref:ABC transporter ATP-binding protein n=1 Tax=Microbacterium sorbitolivorans TaxID=1867410 RepID=A0A367Y401_9MICO|nr:ABC transporter ATP-binding protein [Microbacterium sorbitolivorans]GGF39727.1 molybdenum ABC transporter ATP-binding protein [Microbacterium sorbitolivorans]
MVGVAGQIVVRRSAEFTLDAEIAVEPGGVAAIMGPSGAGKSTLLAALDGSAALTGGSLAIGEQHISANGRLDRRTAGVVLLDQRPLLFPHLSVRENVAFGLRAAGASRRDARGRADEWLARVGLPGRGSDRPQNLSGGQQQRVALARALATEPRLLLLDEPLTSLDPVTASDIRTMMREQLADTATTTILVTHDAFDAASLASRLFVLEAGSIVQHGPVREVLENPATRFVAATAGLNRLVGVAAGGAWVTGAAGSPVRLRAADPAPVPDGSALVALFRPSEVALCAGEPPEGGWPTRVDRLEPSPGGARVWVRDPGLVVEITSAELARLDLAPGDIVGVAVPPEHVRLLADPVPGAARSARGFADPAPADPAPADPAPGAAPAVARRAAA